jgi:hypothetical protein
VNSPFDVPSPPARTDGGQPDPEWFDLPDGQVAFYTAFENETYQQCRPRVWCVLHDLTEMDGERKVDGNNVFRASAWRGKMKIGIITKDDYTAHNSLRAAVLSIIPMCQPTFQADGSGIPAGGVNQYLKYHEVGLFQIQNGATTITPQENMYRTDFPINLTFSVRESAWPVPNITN